MEWTLAQKVGFRWLFTYVILFCLQAPQLWPWSKLVPWVGDLLGADAQFRMNGSGDTAHSYVLTLCFAGIASLVAVSWSIIDRDRANYQRFLLGLRVLVRLWLGMILIGYGAAKVIPSQFPAPALQRLVQPIGEASPMGLLWTFMGASVPYTVFTGAIEMFAGILLFFPQTLTLGALLSIGVLAQIVALNLCYDVPVKLFSLHLLLLAIFLATPDLRRLANFFVFNKTVEAARREKVLQRPAHLRVAAVLKFILLLGVVVTSLYQSHSMRASMLPVPRPELYGIWEVEEFAVKGENGTIQPPTGDHWQRLIIGGPAKFAFVQRLDGKAA